MTAPRCDGGARDALLHPDPPEPETERLPVPVAALAIGLLSLASWDMVAGLALLVLG